MKSIVLFVPLAMVAISLTKKSPISETTYTSIETACNTCCLANTPGDNKYIYYCSCGCEQVVENIRFVVDSQGLKSEKDLVPHIREFFPNQEQINSCKYRAGL